MTVGSPILGTVWLALQASLVAKSILARQRSRLTTLAHFVQHVPLERVPATQMHLGARTVRPESIPHRVGELASVARRASSMIDPLLAPTMLRPPPASSVRLGTIRTMATSIITEARWAARHAVVVKPQPGKQIGIGAGAALQVGQRFPIHMPTVTSVVEGSTPEVAIMAPATFARTDGTVPILVLLTSIMVDGKPAIVAPTAGTPINKAVPAACMDAKVARLASAPIKFLAAPHAPPAPVGTIRSKSTRPRLVMSAAATTNMRAMKPAVAPRAPTNTTRTGAAELTDAHAAKKVRASGSPQTSTAKHARPDDIRVAIIRICGGLVRALLRIHALARTVPQGRRPIATDTAAMVARVGNTPVVLGGALVRILQPIIM